MYDVRKLKTAEECRRVLERAKARGMDDVMRQVFRRLCELVGNEHDDPDDPMVRDFYEALAAYEQLLTDKNGKVTVGTYTRRKIVNKGIPKSLIEWTLEKEEKNGFTLHLAGPAGIYGRISCGCLR